MLIRLEDGPATGREIHLPDGAVRSGRVLIPYGKHFSVAVYEMRRYIEPWKCLIPGVWQAEPVFCAEPTHRWFFVGHRGFV